MPAGPRGPARRIARVDGGEDATTSRNGEPAGGPLRGPDGGPGDGPRAHPAGPRIGPLPVGPLLGGTGPMRRPPYRLLGWGLCPVLLLASPWASPASPAESPAEAAYVPAGRLALAG